MEYFQGKNANKYACGEAARTCNAGKEHRLRTFLEPLAIGFDDPNNSDPTENNIALLFHEALHGFRNISDTDLAGCLGSPFNPIDGDNRPITLYLSSS